MPKVRIIAEGQEWDPDGDGNIEPLPVGTEIEGPDAWRLCLRGFRNSPPIAEPADDATAEIVQSFVAARAPEKASILARMQSQLNALANTKSLGITWGADGQPKRDANGEIVGKLSNLQRHRIETALAYDLVPVIAQPASAS